MVISDEIIKVLEYLCEKIGLTIDWTNDNVLPYIEMLCSKFVQWEIATSTAWIVLWLVCLLFTLIVAIILHKLDFTEKHLDVSHVEWWVFAFVALIVIIAIATQAFDIITCQVFPEKAIYDYITDAMNTASTR